MTRIYLYILVLLWISCFMPAFGQVAPPDYSTPAYTLKCNQALDLLLDGKKEELKVFLEECPYCENEVRLVDNKNGASLAVYAAMVGDLDLIREIIDVESKYVQYEQGSILKGMDKYIPDYHANIYGDNYFSPFRAAVAAGHLEIVKYLYENNEHYSTAKFVFKKNIKDTIGYEKEIIHKSNSWISDRRGHRDTTFNYHYKYYIPEHFSDIQLAAVFGQKDVFDYLKELWGTETLGKMSYQDWREWYELVYHKGMDTLRFSVEERKNLLLKALKITRPESGGIARAITLFELGRLSSTARSGEKDAEKYFGEALRVIESNSKQRYYKLKAQILLARADLVLQSDRSLAKKYLEEAYKLSDNIFFDYHPQHHKTVQRLIQIFMEERNYDRALEYVLESVEITRELYSPLSPEFLPSWNQIFDFYEQSGMLLSADALLKSLGWIMTQDQKLEILLKYILLSTKLHYELEKVDSFYTKAKDYPGAAANPNFLVLFLRHAEVKYCLKDYDSADIIMQSVLNPIKNLQNDFSIEIKARAAINYANFNFNEKAEKLMEEVNLYWAKKNYANNLDLKGGILFELSRTKIHSGKYTEADSLIAIIQKLSTGFPDRNFYELKKLYAESLYAQGRKEEFKKVLREMDALHDKIYGRLQGPDYIDYNLWKIRALTSINPSFTDSLLTETNKALNRLKINNDLQGLQYMLDFAEHYLSIGRADSVLFLLDDFEGATNYSPMGKTHPLKERHLGLKLWYYASLSEDVLPFKEFLVLLDKAYQDFPWLKENSELDGFIAQRLGHNLRQNMWNHGLGSISKMESNLELAKSHGHLTEQNKLDTLFYFFNLLKPVLSVVDNPQNFIHKDSISLFKKQILNFSSKDYAVNYLFYVLFKQSQQQDSAYHYLSKYISDYRSYYGKISFPKIGPIAQFIKMKAIDFGDTTNLISDIQYLIDARKNWISNQLSFNYSFWGLPLDLSPAYQGIPQFLSMIREKREVTDKLFELVLWEKSLYTYYQQKLAEFARGEIQADNDSKFYSWQLKSFIRDTALYSNKVPNKSFRELYHGSHSYKILQELTATNTAKVKAGLSEGQAAIEFVEAFDSKTKKTGLAALVLRPEWQYPELVMLENEVDIQDWLVGEALVADAIAPPATSSNIYHDLFHLIWQPLAPLLQGVTTIYYAPAGSLHRVPFAALQDEEGLMLSQKYQLHQVLSTRVVAYSTFRQPLPKPQTAVLFGGIDYDQPPASAPVADTLRSNWECKTQRTLATRGIENGNLQYLRGSEAEVDVCGSTLEEQYKVSTRVIKGSLASEEEFKALDGKPIDILHVATHGFSFDDPAAVKRDIFNVYQKAKDPLIRSGLVMAGANKAWLHPEARGYEGRDDGILTALEISTMDLSKVQLAVLSACDSGLGDIKGSEGVFGLQRALKIAGVKHVLVTLWKISDEKTDEFMLHFYKEWLGEGKTIRQAFQDTQKWVRERPEYNSPYYWAGFVLVE